MKNLPSYLYSPPFIVKKIFNDFQWDSIQNEILLTFDDGPNPDTTEIILKELDKYSVKAIFFCVGENLERYLALGSEILSCGHEIGNHSMKHKKLTSLSNPEIGDAINRVQDIAKEGLNYEIQYFRPPYGKFTLKTSKILRKENLQNVMWSLLTYDYKNDLNIVKFAVYKYLKEDSIIVLHDSNKSKGIIRDAIALIAEKAQQKKYKIGKPSECLRSYSR